MGVHNLWELLAPVGRRVSVETLAGKKLAIDASIWMIQFMKAMRDDKGEMVRNAHILGFFRRICKLLFLRTKPVFVFDGGTPALKRRTVIARRRQRENAQAKIRKTAEKLLLNHLKTMRLKELAEDLENQRQKNDAKGKRKITDEADIAANTSEGTEAVLRSYNQEELDEMLAASLLAEDNESLMHHTTSSAAGTLSPEEDGEEDEEMILPPIHGKVDPAVLAALPPSMQLDLLAQMRERLMAENRQKYQKAKKAPERFSELQIQAYLKTVAFRRDIDEVRKSAAGRGIGGVQTSRIASEANREFIFSSSFSGDKQVLAPAGIDRNSSEQRRITTASADALVRGLPPQNSKASRSVMDQPENVIDDVETYLDERGRVRVSRVRAMGFRMTRDLQRNLDLMKEKEHENLGTAKSTNHKAMLNGSAVGVSSKFPSKIQLIETSDHFDNVTLCLNNSNEGSVNMCGTSMEVSFDDNGENRNGESDDDVFTRLVAGDSDMDLSADPLKKESSDSVSECELEEGDIGGNKVSLNHDVQVGVNPFPEEGHECNENKWEWEEGPVDVHMHASPCPPEYKETDTKDDGNESEVEWEDGSEICKNTLSWPSEYKEMASKGALEEEAYFQEAIRRSLEDLGCQKYIDVVLSDEKLQKGREIQNEGMCFGSVHQEKDWVEPTNSVVLSGAQLPNSESGASISETHDSPVVSLASSMELKQNNTAVSVSREDSYQDIHLELGQDGSGSGNLCGQTVCVQSVTSTEKKGVDLVEKKNVHASSQVDQMPSGTNCSPSIASHILDSVSVDVHDGWLEEAQQFEFKSHTEVHLTESTVPAESLVENYIDSNSVQRLPEGRNDDLVKDTVDSTEISAMMDTTREQVEITEASLEEQMQNLNKERATLGDEQRRLERNSESVSGEMFVECQELLQMFGIPYIIAPMEAEAQCAYMELENLVDGVVTDDSDVFLFGARSVYKNIFDDRKYVETYFMKDIESELGLTREKLIRMALLLGSDYTEGISGIGIVNAMEVINAFSEEDGLSKFREWIESPDPSILGKIDLQAGPNLGKRGSKDRDDSGNCSNNNAEGGASVADQHLPVTDLPKMKQEFMDKHRNVSKNWHIPSSFPSEAVISAYDSPQVDKSTETFSWGKPDLIVLRKLCWEKFGWSNQKADELLVPVLKEYNKHETQLRLEAFYTFNERFAKIRSKRIKNAVKKTTGNKSLVFLEESEDVSRSRKKRKINSNEASPGEHVGTSDGDVARDEITEEPTAKLSAKRRNHDKPSASGGGNSESSTQAVNKQNAKSGASVRARGRGRGRGRGRSAGRGRRKESSVMEFAEILTDDGSDSDTEQVAVENYEGSHEVRRSKRSRKAVKYAMDELDIDEPNKCKQDCGGSAVEGAGEEFLGNTGVVDATAATTIPSNWKHHEMDPLHVESLCSNIEREGGICIDNSELNTGAGQLILNQSGDPCFNADLSEDYLRMGGGFCMDEDEANKDSEENSCRPTSSTVYENYNPSPCSGFMEEAEPYIIGYDHSESVSSSIKVMDEHQAGGHADTPCFQQNCGTPDITNTPHENHSNPAISEGGDFGSKTAGSLIAMLNLRRKRRS